MEHSFPKVHNYPKRLQNKAIVPDLAAMIHSATQVHLQPFPAMTRQAISAVSASHGASDIESVAANMEETGPSGGAHP